MLSFLELDELNTLINEMTDVEFEDMLYLLENDLEEDYRVQKISKKSKRAAHLAYKRNKPEILRQQRKYRRQQKFKKYLKKKERMAKLNRTSTGKRIRTKRYV